LPTVAIPLRTQTSRRGAQQLGSPLALESRELAMPILPIGLAAVALSAQGAPVILVSPSGSISRSSTAALVAERVFVVDAAVTPLAVDLSTSSRTLWVIHETAPAGPLVASRVDLDTGELLDRTDPLPCTTVSDVAAPLTGTDWYVAESTALGTQIWRGDLPHGFITPFAVVLGRPDVTGLSLDLSGRLLAYDAGYQVVLAIDTETASVMPIGATGLAAGAPRGLDLDPNTGALFGIFDAPGVAPRLGRVDPDTGVVELLATLQGEPAPFLAVERGTSPLGSSLTPWTSTAATRAFGSPRREANNLLLEGVGLPTHSFGLFITSRGHLPPTSTVPGALCLLPHFGRAAGAVGHLLPTGAEGRMWRALDLDALPLGGRLEPLGAHGLLHFQAWARAGAAGPTFAQPVSVPIASFDPGPIDRYPAVAGWRPTWVTHGDVDGDGDVDAVVADGYFRHWDLWRNDGSGEFTRSMLFEVGGETGYPETIGVEPRTHVELVDVDGDSDLDLVWTPRVIGGLRSSRNDGTGTFGPVELHGTCLATVGFRVADLDGDGSLDICHACALESKLVVLYGGATGFELPRNYDVPGMPGTPAVVDVDGDGQPDLAVPMENGAALVVLRNAGARSFVSQPPSATIDSPVRCDLLDVVPGGGLELVVWSSMLHALEIHAIAGAASLPVIGHADLPAFSAPPRFEDFDRDGVLDLTGESGGRLLTFRNDGLGSFTPYSTLETTLSSAMFTLADFDGDGWLDALLTSYREWFVLLIRSGYGGWPAPRATVPLPAGVANTVAVEDLDGDGIHDCVTVGTGGVHVVRGLGAGSYAAPLSFASPLSQRRPLCGDIDGDGDLDVVGLSVDALVVHENLGALQLAPAVTTPLTGQDPPIGLDLGDLDRDGDLDAVVSSGDDGMQVLSSDGAGTFTSTWSVGYQCGTLSIVDLDVDGWLDVVVRYTAPLSVHYNDGAGGLLPRQFLGLAQVHGDWIPIADLDDDGLLDIVTEDGVLLNRGVRGLFLTHPLPPGAGLDLGRVALADLDGDGWSDMISTDPHAHVQWVRLFRGVGYGRFDDPQYFVVQDVYAAMPLVRDLDRDGRPEVILGTRGGPGLAHILSR
jgi:hypothetical protein